MTPPFTAHSKCRLCDSGNVEEVLDLGYSPLANAYLTEAQLTEVRSGKREEIFTPLRLLLCMECGSVQMAHSVDPAVLFTDYIYASSTSPVFVKHFDDFAKHVQELGMVDRDELVVDIGSNDGIALKAFESVGCRTLGVEPSNALADIAESRGLDTLRGFWNKTLAIDIANLHGKAQLITATNVFAHLSDLRGFVEGVLELLANDGVFIFEVSYLGDVVEHMLFDTIYMEHQFYHALNPLFRLFDGFGVRIFRIERISTHGGSVRVFVGRADIETTQNDLASVVSATGLEGVQKLEHPKTYRQFYDRLQCYKHRLASIVRWRSDRNTTLLCAYGCPAKFTTFCYALEGVHMQFVIDDSPLKVGRFTPGTHIPIISKSDVPKDPDGRMVIVPAWNFFDSILKANKSLAHYWLRPLPNLEVINV